ncbi:MULTISPECIES: hypothetical protein [unclassified Amycolatopsis]|uniref:hypothetical protein n=1 Tax=unclassified Amycolatopsis TaxID=2618356 RepID=UPI00106EC561|nr:MULTISPECIES: hypothetical protein [unclassified Amycolatopsis]
MARVYGTDFVGERSRVGVKQPPAGSALVGVLVTAKQHGHYELGAVDYATVAVGPDEAADVVQLGLVGTVATPAAI